MKEDSQTISERHEQRKKSVTLDYYDKHVKQFVMDTLNVDFVSTQDRFLEKVPSGGFILDFGCGSGRDTKYFLEHGYQVDAIDGCEEMCRLATVYTGIDVKHKLFEELNETAKYDGIWACASILHLTSCELKDVFVRIDRALKKNGFLYASFKYGEFEGNRNGRYFTDMTEEKLDVFLQEIHTFALEEKWITSDVRPGRDEEKWLNIILQKIQ